VLDWFCRAHDGPLVDRYNSELFLSGLERVEEDEGDLITAARREQLDQYQSRWLRLELAPTEDIPLNSSDLYDIVGGMLARKVPKKAGTIRFSQIGSSARGVPRFEWEVQCPEHFLNFKIDPASNVFVTLTPVNK
jgi:hypothetical protein